MNEIIPVDNIASKIYLIREQKVMLDRDLAQLYGLATKNLNKAVSRNMDRFPSDFMFKLSDEEAKNLMFQIGTSSWTSQNGLLRWGGRRKLPRVFTEQGIAMLSSVLHSKRAIQVNIAIMRAFVKIKQVLATHQAVSKKLKELEERLDKTDANVAAVFQAIRKMLEPAAEPKNRIGFQLDDGK